MIECIVANWGITIVLALLFTVSEWLSKTNKTKANGVLDFIQLFLKHLLQHKGDHK